MQRSIFVASLFVCWQRTFMALDMDNSGHFNRSEFHRSLTTLGIVLTVLSYYYYVMSQL